MDEEISKIVALPIVETPYFILYNNYDERDDHKGVIPVALRHGTDLGELESQLCSGRNFFDTIRESSAEELMSGDLFAYFVYGRFAKRISFEYEGRKIDQEGFLERDTTFVSPLHVFTPDGAREQVEIFSGSDEGLTYRDVPFLDLVLPIISSGKPHYFRSRIDRLNKVKVYDLPQAIDENVHVLNHGQLYIPEEFLTPILPYN